MNRRKFLLLAALPMLPMTSMAAQSLTEESLKNIKPYIEVGPYKDDEKNVFIFLSFDCQFCFQNIEGFDRWQDTAPDAIKVTKIPLFSAEKGSLHIGAAYAAAKILDKKRLRMYEHYCFKAVIEKSQSMNDPSTFVEAAVAAGYDRNSFIKALVSTKAKEEVARMLVTLIRYHPEYTPSVVLGGKYMLNAVLVNGNYENMFRMMNGIASQIIRGG